MTADSQTAAATYTPEEYVQFAKALRTHPDYRVMRKIKPFTAPIKANFDPSQPLRQAIILDTETTGLDDESEVIDLGILPIVYQRNLVQVQPIKDWQPLQQPSAPLKPEIVKLTGYSDQDLAGKKIDVDRTVSVLSKTDFIIAHNARYDRAVIDRFLAKHGITCDTPWVCTMSMLPWRDHGYESTKLPHLLADHNLFYDKHAATPDCWALAALLTLSLGGRPVFEQLLDTYATPTLKITMSPRYEERQIAKDHGFQFVPDQKVWRGSLSEPLAKALMTVLDEKRIPYKSELVAPKDRFKDEN